MISKLDPDLFHKAFETVNMVDEGSVRSIRSPAGSTVNIDGTDYTFTANPILNMVEATRIVFPDPMEGMAASMRLFYLLDLVGREEVAPLMQVDGGNLLIHRSLIRAMAQVTLDEDGYDMDELVQLAKDNLQAEAEAASA